MRRSMTERLWMTIALGALVGPGIGAADPATEEPVAYPQTIYPLQARQALRTTEAPPPVPLAGETFGFEVPFPAGDRRTITVEDYGAVADGVTDCTLAFYSALRAAVAEESPAEVVFGSRGRYLFRPAPDLGSDTLAILNVVDARNLLIRGQGMDTALVMADPALGGLCVRGGEQIMVRDLSIDYNPLPFTQGRVTELNAEEGWFLLTLDEGYPTPQAINERIPPGWHGGYRMARSADGAYRWPVIGPLMITAVEPVDAATWRLRADPQALKGHLQPGEEFIYVGRRIAQQALTGARTRGFYVKDVGVHASPTCGLGLWETDGAQIDGYADTAPAGSNRMLASNADALFCHGARGGVTIRNCYFMGQGDDCINLHCPAFAGQHVRVEGPAEVTLLADVDVRAGDVLEVMDPTVSRIKGQVEVREATPAADGSSLRVQLAQPLAAVGYDPAVDYLYPASLAAPSFRIAHNYFGQNRSRCLLIQARGGVIEGNTFENAEGYGIILGYGGTAWAEGVIPRDVTIRGNVFRNVTNAGLASVIQVGDGSQFRNYSGLQILDNRFIDARKMAIQLVGVAGARLAGNVVESEPGRRNTWNHPEWFPVDCSLYLDNCTGIEVEGLSVRDPNITEAAVFIGSACDPGEAGVRLLNVAADLPPNVPMVKDAR
ncbi:MAG: hypothetical protein FJX74_00435 [Armatimonadetes bacterium]|nr:hypothetical protein [Armatimonadota bacterium]